MKKIKGKSFTSQEVPLDANHYEGCKFESCTFVFAGTDRFGLSNNRISKDCNFLFTGAAENTVNGMQAIYSMGEWGRNTVRKTFQEIATSRFSKLVFEKWLFNSFQ